MKPFLKNSLSHPRNKRANKKGIKIPIKKGDKVDSRVLRVAEVDSQKKTALIIIAIIKTVTVL